MFKPVDSARRIVLRFRRIVSFAVQLLIVVLSNRAAFALRFDGNTPAWAIVSFWTMLPWLAAIRGLTFFPFRMYEGLWRYTSIYDLRALIGSVATSSVLFYAVARLLGPAYPRSIFVTDAILLVLTLGGLRLTRRLYAEFTMGGPRKRVLIVGAGDAGELLAREMRANRNTSLGYRPVGFVDDDIEKLGRRIHGVPVLGTRHDVAAILEDTKPDEILIAMPSADPAAIRAIVRTFDPYKLPIKTLPKLTDIIDGTVGVSQIRSLAVEDLLSRAPVGLNPKSVRLLIAGRRVMVTGAGGSIGSELCRQIAKLNPASLIMLDRYENSLHAVRLELEDSRRSVGLQPVIADVTDAPRIDQVLARYQPEIIFHAAAHKHVPLMEENPCEAVKNNVRGTRIMAEAADRHGVDRFILISTDKAVNPICVMGATKRIAELLLQAKSSGSGTSFSTVRFGNVLGSNGSVIPRFLEQIHKGGPVTVTHPEMRRYFMLIPEAVHLVLHAASQAEGGGTYVLEMGEQLKLVDIARDLIRLSGFAPEEDIKIEFIGIRPGEKLEEELVGPDEDVEPSTVAKVMCVRSRRAPAGNLVPRVLDLESIADGGDVDVTLATMQGVVGAFVPTGRSAAVRESEIEQATVAELAHASFDEPCPACRHGRARRSRVRSLPEKMRREFSARRPYRCVECGWRGWLMPLDYGDRAGTGGGGDPDLATLDRATSAPAPPRVVFAPRDLA